MFNIKAAMKSTMESFFKRKVQEIYFSNGLYIIHIESDRFGACLDEMYCLYEVSRFGIVFKTSYVEQCEHVISNIFMEMEEAQQFKIN